MHRDKREVTLMLVKASEGNAEAISSLLPLVYDELREMAVKFMQIERQGHTLRATALVHEAYLRLIDQKQVKWQNRAHFFGVAAQAMRRVLVDYARKHTAQKRGGGMRKVSLDETPIMSEEKTEELLALDEALNRLKVLDERQSRIVELRFFGGLNIDETAHVLQISPASVKRDWSMAKAWLYQQVQQGLN